MKIQISNLIDALLDWAVAKCDGKMLTPYAYGFLTSNGYPFRPSSNWGQGGLVIERERIKLKPSKDGGEWLANLGACQQSGETALIAAMRCYVSSKLGDEVDIPADLLC